jgi:hypothetical protein
MLIDIKGIKFDLRIMPNAVARLEYDGIIYYMPVERLNNLEASPYIKMGYLDITKYSDIVYNITKKEVIKCRYDFDNMVSMMYETLNKNQME